MIELTVTQFWLLVANSGGVVLCFTGVFNQRLPLGLRLLAVLGVIINVSAVVGRLC